MSQYRYEVTDEQWDQIKDFFPLYTTGRLKRSNRSMFNAILWIARSDATWRDLLVSIFQALNDEADFENFSIDSTVIKAHQHNAGAKKGLSITKITNISASVVEEKPRKFMSL